MKNSARSRKSTSPAAIATGAMLLGVALCLLFATPAAQTRAKTRPQPVDLAPVEVTFQSGDITLHGYLYKPDGDGPFPAILWNHGSEKMPGWLPEIAPDVVARGFVLFVPHRRGQGRSPGEYVMDQVNRAADIGGNGARDRTIVAFMRLQFDDQVAAMTFLQGLGFVDPKRVAVMGCSFGGIQTVMMAEKGMGVRAAVDFAGAAQTWEKAPLLRGLMTDAVQHAQMPVFFAQAQNDYDLAPTNELAAEMEKAHLPHTVQIFPKFGKSNQDAHDFCVHGEKVWGAPIFDFITKAFQQ